MWNLKNQEKTRTYGLLQRISPNKLDPSYLLNVEHSKQKSFVLCPFGTQILMSYYNIIFTVMKYISIFYLTTNYFIIGHPEDDMSKSGFYEDLQILKNFYR